jgi:hypothetical protein
MHPFNLAAPVAGGQGSLQRFACALLPPDPAHTAKFRLFRVRDIYVTLPIKKGGAEMGTRKEKANRR